MDYINLRNIVSKFWKPNFYSLFEYFHYFLIGIFIAELYLDRGETNIKKNPVWFQVLSIPLFFIFFIGLKITDITYLGKIADWYKIVLSVSQLCILILFFYLIIIKKYWPLFFQNPTICILGGMCYSIYLVHNPVISGLGYYFFNRYHDHLFIITYKLYFPYLLSAVILVGLIFYILIERPTMKKDWWKAQYNF